MTISIETPPDYDYSAIYKTPNSVNVYRQWYEDRLQSLGLPHERLTVETRFGPTHVVAVGPANAQPLVLVHGAQDSSMAWESQLQYFAYTKTHRVYALDVNGFSPMSAPIRPAETSSDYAIWLFEVITALGLMQADFVGVASGCSIICRLAGYAPNRVRSAILLTPLGLTAANSISLLYYFTVLGVVLFPNRYLVKRFISYLLAQPCQLSQPMQDMMVDHNLMVFKHCQLGGSVNISDEQLSKLKSPTLIMLGQQNRIVKMGEAIERVRRVLPGAYLDLVPGAATCIEIEQADYLNMAIMNFTRQQMQYAGAAH